MEIKLVYVAGPFRGPNAWAIENNIRRAEELGFQVAEVGAMPLIPHCNTRFFNGTLSDSELWLPGTLEMLRRCDAAIFLPTWEFSTGARAEREECVRLRIPTFDRVEDLKKWLHNTRRLSEATVAHEMLLEHAANMLPIQQRVVRAAYEEWQRLARRRDRAPDVFRDVEADDNGIQAPSV